MGPKSISWYQRKVSTLTDPKKTIKERIRWGMEDAFFFPPPPIPERFEHPVLGKKTRTPRLLGH